MKRKLSPKKEQRKKASAPTPNPEASQGEAIPPGLKFFTELKKKTGAQQAAAVFPAFADALARGDIKQIEATSGFLSDLAWIWACQSPNRQKQLRGNFGMSRI